MRLTTALCSAFLAGAASADVRVPAIFSDHMVVQRRSEVPIWGWADPHERVTLSAPWVNAALDTTADDRGRWRIVVQTPDASGPFDLEIAGRNRVKISDVWIGEVWVCSGQSNMEWPLAAADGGPEEAKAADVPRLRLFNVENTIAAGERDDCRGQWSVCSPQTVGRFSAVAYFFARRLQGELDVPIGLIETDWGGTPAEAWTSEAGLTRFPEFADSLKTLARMRESAGDLEQERARATEAWHASLAARDAGIAGLWMESGTDVSGWESLPVPGAWSGKLGSFDGILWTRREFALPPDWAGHELVLEMGAIDDADDTFINGKLIGGRWDAAAFAEARRYTIPSTAVHAGENTIAIRILDTGGPGGVNGAPRLTLAGHPPISLSGEWKCRVGAPLADLPRRPASRDLTPNTPTSLFNGMIAPIAGYAIRGGIWYQGEANVDRAFQYCSLFPAMIADWRRRWGRGDFPFYYVQIAPFGYRGDRGQAAELREAQLMALSTANTGMAVTMDIGNPGDIHPRNKRDVGNRLALIALAGTYGKTGIECSGPTYLEMRVEGDKARLRFDHAAGLTAGGGSLQHFMVAGDDQKFANATAAIDGESVVVSSPSVPHPVAVRYCWGASDEGTLVNGAGLPASSFRTDAWRGLTQP
jgi:sialate O-acetylesterase